MKKHKKSGVSIVEAVIALTVIVLVCATALTIVLSSVSAKVAAVNKSRAQSFASDAFECFKVSDTEQEFIDNMSFAGGAELTFTDGFCKYTSPKYKFTAEITLNYGAARPVFEISVKYQDKELIAFSYTKGGGEQKNEEQNNEEQNNETEADSEK